jgi:hypothetical protein
VPELNPGAEQAEARAMHGAWLFDLVLAVVAGGTVVLAFRQIDIERRQND